MINLPNKFWGINVTMELNTLDSKDWKKLISINKTINTTIQEKLYSSNRKVYITFSSMKSTINSAECIEYHEVILKLPLVINGSEYVFPIISFVDNEMSFLRGTFLGYYKKLLDFGSIYVKNSEVGINSTILNVSCHYSKDGCKDVVPDFNKPFVLNGTVGKNELDEKCYTLKVRNYIQKYLCEADKSDSSDVVLFGKKYSIENIWVSEDSFVLEGLNDLV